MKIDEIIKNTDRSLSFEFFPPNTPRGEEKLFERISRLEAFKPSFVSVTQHAGRDTLQKTKQIVKKIHGRTNLTVMPHITCADPRRSELEPVINYYRDLGIENILALRGDPDEYGNDVFDGETHFRFASDLVKFVATYRHFCTGVAIYPEGHLDSPNLGIDIAFTKQKIEAGAKFAITQMFFENFYYYQMMDRFEQNHIDIPVIAGIMPITDFAKVERFSESSGVEMPVPITRKFEELEDPADVLKAGIELATGQCLDLWENGVRCFHFYTLNQDNAVIEILNNLKTQLG